MTNKEMTHSEILKRLTQQLTAAHVVVRKGFFIVCTIDGGRVEINHYSHATDKSMLAYLEEARTCFDSNTESSIALLESELSDDEKKKAKMLNTVRYEYVVEPSEGWVVRETLRHTEYS